MCNDHSVNSELNIQIFGMLLNSSFKPALLFIQSQNFPYSVFAFVPLLLQFVLNCIFCCCFLLHFTIISTPLMLLQHQYNNISPVMSSLISFICSYVLSTRILNGGFRINSFFFLTRFDLWFIFISYFCLPFICKYTLDH